ncbi:MAG TPA: NAD-dependent epimerase/dehydratase family protein [Cyclobacteriaceae bacterium]|jgi:nucleoside-diphosphate-sugar epimerase|nr:NAD-dependent epimerase/dehydratase family protein [Cytophagales bacterium]HMR56279.1 NAD-dependent epimerase/dehydratase family protein [Cyclobacteriaceae bacterium]HNT49342.1 NAD-dependent epimerase/dehydratase family protein [Cyclobacteriaceae bacterium]HRE65960.1 NAD-dependent epimerase/dehydratase family protein [Cyclobacteriaceae bacterium]HRF33932.1 NAD-dependent epimerase/dehydratase family protein [Cyclobacteriaceae bacterium]
MTKILITGGAGFIGSSLAERLLTNPEHFVVLVDNLLTGELRKLPQHEKCKFIKCDVNHYHDIAAIMTSYQFDYVFHFAAVVGVKRTLENPVQVLNDLSGIKNILDLSKNTGVKRVFFSSSSEVYGEPVELPQNEETTPLNSRLPYAVVKNVGEAFCRSYQQEFGLSFTIFRFFNTYGPRQSTDFVISKFISSALNHTPITIYGKGAQTRTFCYIDDNVDCMVKILEQNLMVNDVINIGNERDYTILQLAQTIIDLTKSKSEIVYLPPLKEGDMTRRQPDASKMKSILNRELLPLDKGIARILNEKKYFL